MFILILLLLFLVGIVIWIAFYAVCEFWSLWVQHKYKVRFRLHTCLILLSASCATAGVMNLMGNGLPIFDGIILTTIVYVFMLGAAFFADMLIRDTYQAVSGRRGNSMAAYRAADDDTLELNEKGQPIVPPTDRPIRRRESARPKIYNLSLRNSQGGGLR